jgi:hypothetical protein
MPIHDWTKVPSGIFHDFHHAWIEEIKRLLNRGQLPEGYYALAEQLTGRLGPDVLALHWPQNGGKMPRGNPQGGVNVAERMPKVRFHARTETDTYAAKAKVVSIRHASHHDVVAMVEIVSPGNKSSKARIDSFVLKAHEALDAGIHLLIVDLFPPTSRDPEGLHPLIWEDRGGEFEFIKQKPMTCAAYVADLAPEAFVEPIAIGDTLPEMPLFLTPDVYVNVALETTYQSAWAELPQVWRDVLTA